MLQNELPTDAPVHVLLAGNGSRSRHVQTLFDTDSPYWSELVESAFGNSVPEMVIHPPLAADESHPHAPTAKTGVALGLLRLAPGEGTLLLDHTRSCHDGQAPFCWFIGKLSRSKFVPILSPGAHYGTWHDLGPLQQRVFNLFASSSPRSRTGLSEGDPELCKERLDFPAGLPGARLFVRAVGPHKIELLTSAQLPDPAVAGERLIDFG